jgi:tetratricopeptide (TPR) repeat protein
MSRILTALLVALLLGASPARAEWWRAESPNFIVFGEMPQERLRARAALLEEFDTFLRLLTGTTEPPAANKLRVYIAAGTPELMLVAPVGPGVGGFYRANGEGVAIVVDDDTNWRGNEDDTLLHEYAHHFMMQYHPAPYPAWYVEGFADYVMTARITPRRIEFGNYSLIRASWLTGSSDWISYDDILFGNLKRISAGPFYAQSWLLVHYIMADEGRRAAFIRYIQALSRGEEARAAFTTAFRTSTAELQRTLRDYSRRITYRRIERAGPQAAPQIEMTRLDRRGLNPPLLEAALLLGTAETHNRRLILAQSRRLRRSTDAYNQRLRARAEILLGDQAAADALLDQLLAESPADPELLYLKGLRHLTAARRNASIRAAEYRLAGGYFARAIRADPNYWQALFHYAETLSPEALQTENSRNILLLASQLAPQVIEIRLAAAHVLLLRGEFERAETLLLPVTPTIHTPDGADRAVALLRLARTRQRPDDPVVFKIAASGQPDS